MFSPNVEAASSSNETIGDPNYRFETVRLGVDRRLLMNRKRKLKMYRVWMQGIFRKPLDAIGSTGETPKSS